MQSGGGSLRRTSRRRRQLRRRRMMLAGGGVLLVLLLLGALELSRLGPAISELDGGEQVLADATRALGNSPGTWTTARIATATPLAREARDKLVSGRDHLRHDPLLNLLRPIPLAGDQVNAAYHLSDAGVGASDAFAQLLAVARVYDAAREDGSPPGRRLLNLLSASSGPLAAAHDDVHQPLLALDQDMSRPLLPGIHAKVQEAVNRLGPVDASAAAGSAAGKHLPAALGADGSRTYLVLMANPAELRPAGGFAGAVGSVTFDNGAPSALHVTDQSRVSALVQGHFEPPYPLGRYLVFQNNSLELGDSTWDPDFPSSAALAEKIYHAATGTAVDGTISIDPYAIASLLALTGPVDVPPYGRFDSSNFFTRIDHIVNVDRSPGAGKGALGPIAEAVLHRVLAQPVSAWPSLLSTFQDQARRRHVQFALHDADLARAAHDVGYDGALVAGHQDYLLAVDGNVGATKGDFYATKTMRVLVELPASGVSRHEVRLDYDLPLPKDADDRALNPGNGEYRDYVRVYLPESASLSSFHFTEDGKPSTDGGLDRIMFEHGRAVIGAFFRLPRGHRVEVRLDYEVPLAAGNSYELFVQKQAGIPGRATSVDVSYPGGQATRSTDLVSDADFKFAW